MVKIKQLNLSTRGSLSSVILKFQINLNLKFFFIFFRPNNSESIELKDEKGNKSVFC